MTTTPLWFLKLCIVEAIFQKPAYRENATYFFAKHGEVFNYIWYENPTMIDRTRPQLPQSEKTSNNFIY